MSAQHTPGPWEWDGCSISDFGREYPCSMSMEWIPNGSFADYDGERVNANVEADARLIAAAPELLEALEAVIRAYNRQGVNRGEIDLATAAIAKAQGEP